MRVCDVHQLCGFSQLESSCSYLKEVDAPGGCNHLTHRKQALRSGDGVRKVVGESWDLDSVGRQ